MATGPPAKKKNPCITVLPAELRVRIYHLALGGRILHISEELHLTGACYMRGARAKRDARRERKIEATRSNPDANFACGSYLEHHEDCIDRPNVSLLLASRTTYSEAKPIFYGKNNFQFSSILAFCNFIKQHDPTTVKRYDHKTLEQLRYITLLVRIDPRAEGFTESLRGFLAEGVGHASLGKTLFAVKGVKTLHLIIETRTSQRRYPNLDTAQLLGQISNRLDPGRTTACMYHPKRRDFRARLSERALGHFEDLAMGGDGLFYDGDDEQSGDESHTIDEDRARDWAGPYTDESSDDDERWDEIYLDDRGGDVSESLGDLSDEDDNGEDDDDNSEDNGDDSEDIGDDSEESDE